MQLTVKTTVGIALSFIGLLSLIIVLSVSFAIVSDDEICELFYPGKL